MHVQNSCRAELAERAACPLWLLSFTNTVVHSEKSDPPVERNDLTLVARVNRSRQV